MQKNLVFAIIFSFIFVFFSDTFFQRKDSSKAISLSNQFELSDDNPIDTNHILKIESKVLNGEMNLQGLRINHAKLLQYNSSLDSEEKVEVLTKDQDRYFVSFGFSGSGIQLPNSKTIWHTNSDILSEDKPVTLTWTNDDGIIFKVNLKIIDDYLIRAEMSMQNLTKNTYDVSGYALLNKSYDLDKTSAGKISHEGLTGVINSKLEEYSYSSIKDDKEKLIPDSVVDWFGISDKYWMAAIIPSKDRLYNINVIYDFVNQKDKIQVDITTKKLKLEPQEAMNVSYDLFLGPKEFQTLEKYKDKFGIELFDRAIDFGWLYPITKPLFLMLSYINKYVMNFGFSILILTLLIKILMFGISNKATKSMEAIKEIQPQIDNLKVRYANDKLQLNKEILNLYKVYKINPFMGFLSMLIQIPIFFGIYKVLYVTLEMRQAPFIWWIKDLSAPDPANIFNMFGLIDYAPPSYLHLGALPILMSLSMYIQQSMTPIKDPVQAKIIRFLPLIFLFTFNSFPAGLLVYWTFSNLIGIIQQFIGKKYA